MEICSGALNRLSEREFGFMKVTKATVLDDTGVGAEEVGIPSGLEREETTHGGGPASG